MVGQGTTIPETRRTRWRDVQNCRGKMAIGPISLTVGPIHAAISE